MRYFGRPKWRNLAIPFVVLSIIPAAIVSLLSIGTIRALVAWSDAMDWVHYYDE